MNNVGIITINADVNANIFFDKVRCNDGFIWNPNICKCECDKSCDAGEYLEYEKCKCIKKLTLECEDEILNTADTAQLLIKKVTCKNNCLIYIILFIIMCLILANTVSIIFCYYYTRY